MMRLASLMYRPGMNSRANRAKSVKTDCRIVDVRTRFNGFFAVSPGIHSWAESRRSPWEGWDAPDEIDGVARTFVRANALNPEIALKQLDTQLELDLYGDNPGPE
jgi:hypothetical protein